MAPSRALWRQAARVCTYAGRSSAAIPVRRLATRPQAGAVSASPVRRTTQASVHHSQTRLYSSAVEPEAAAPEAPDYLSEGELKIFNIIKEKLEPVKLEVQDISGGCGSMYALDIVSEQFKGIPVIKQHRLVNSVLGEEIKKWHGVQLKTKAP